MARPKGPPRSSDGPSMALLAALAIVIGLALWWWQSGMVPFWETLFGDSTPARPQRSVVDPIRPPVELPVAKAPDAPMPPIENPLPELAEKDKPKKPLPPVDRSDPVVLESLLANFSGALLTRYVNMQDFVHRLVVTVDNLPRELVPSQMSVFQRVPGLLEVDKSTPATMTLGPENFRRYDGLVAFLDTLDPGTLVRLYLRFYPLLDQEYKTLGYPQARFHDRVINAIDDLLAAPSPAGPIELIQPKVLYRYADPALQNLSAGQKIMIRVGPDHAAKLKQMLRRLRSSLLGQAPG